MRRALAHRSWVAETGGTEPSNERLEFLGDAVLGAIYVDSGTEAAYAFVERVIGEHLYQAVLQLDRLDFKTMLQEIAVRRFDVAPVYVLSEDGPDHAKNFFASVMIAGQTYGRGEGRSKKLAEQAAAGEACINLGREEPVQPR